MLTRGPLLFVGALGVIWLLVSFMWAYGTIGGAKEQAQATYGKLIKAAGVSDVRNATLGVCENLESRHRIS
jgi:hypothetical protein